MNIKIVYISLSILFSLILCPLTVRAENAQIIIGALLPLTGELSFVGEDIRRGMALALEENESASVKIKVIYEDTRNQAKDAVSGAKKLLEIDRADILISLWDMSDPVAPIAERAQVPHLCIRWNPHIAEKFAFTATFESTYITYVTSQIKLLETLEIKSAAVVAEEAQGSILAANEFVRQAAKKGISVLADERYDVDTTDFRTISTRLLAKNPEIIVSVALNQPVLNLLIKRIREQRPDQKIMGYFEAFQPLSAIEGMPFVGQNDVSPSFIELFKKKYGEDFKVRAPHGFDLVRMIATIYEKAGNKLSGKEFIDQFAKIKSYPGVTGVLSANATKNIENEPVWMIVKDGKMVRFKP